MLKKAARKMLAKLTSGRSWCDKIEIPVHLFFLLFCFVLSPFPYLTETNKRLLLLFLAFHTQQVPLYSLLLLCLLLLLLMLSQILNNTLIKFTSFFKLNNLF